MSDGSLRIAAALLAAIAFSLAAGSTYAHPDFDVHPRTIENALPNDRAWRDTMWVDNDEGNEVLEWALEVQAEVGGWISAAPQSGQLNPGQGQIVVVRQDGRDLEQGHYYATLHFTSNDPTRAEYDVPVAGHTAPYPRIEATWAIPGQGEWWGIDLDRIIETIEWGRTYGFDLNIRNRGSARLDCDTIICNNAYFTIAPGDFDLDAGANRAVRVTFNAREVGGNSGTISSTSNAWDPRELNFRITATVDPVFRMGGGIPDAQFDEDAREILIADLDTVFVSSYAETRIELHPGPGLLTRLARNNELFLRSRANWNGSSRLILTAATGDSILSDTVEVSVTPIPDPPDPFDLILPEDGDTLNFDRGDSLLIWQTTSDPDGDSVFYTLRLYHQDWADSIPGLTVTSFPLFDLYYRDGIAGRFLWNVTATGGGLERSSWSTMSFYLEDSRQQADKPPAPGNFRLAAFPNPFNSLLTVSVEMPVSGECSIALFDLAGAAIGELNRGELKAGKQTFVFDAKDLAGGIYFIRADFGRESFFQKVLLLK